MEVIDQTPNEEQQVVFRAALAYIDREETDVIYERMIEDAKDRLALVDRRVHTNHFGKAHLLARYKKVLELAEDRLLEQLMVLESYGENEPEAERNKKSHKLALESVQRGAGVAQFFYNEILARCESLEERIAERKHATNRIDLTTVSFVGAAAVNG